MFSIHATKPLFSRADILEKAYYRKNEEFNHLKRNFEI